MNRHLVFKGATSDRFWRIEVKGKLFTVAYGKTSSTEVSHAKTFSNDVICQVEAEKILKQKVTTGYNESDVNRSKEPIELAT